MHAQRRNRQSRRLTTAGLIAVSAATLVMMAWAVFPTAAFAGSGTQLATAMFARLRILSWRLAP